LLLFEFTKRQWGEIHLWFSLAAIVVTVAHLVVDWRGLCGCMKYLASVHRSGEPETHPISPASGSHHPA
jgi:hypothetical protein